MKAIKMYWAAVRPERPRFLGLVFLLVISGAFEAVGLVSMVPALTEISRGNTSSLYLLLIPLSVILLGTLLKFLSETLQARLISDIESRLRQELVNQVFFSNWKNVRKLSQGSITNGVVSEASQIANGVIVFTNSIGTSFIVLIFWIAAFALEPILAIVISTFLTIIGLLVRLRLRKFSLIEKNMRSGYEKVSEKVSSLLSEIKFARLSSQRSFWTEQIHAQSIELSSARKKQLTLPAANRAILESSAAVFLVTCLGGMALVGLPLAKGIVFLGIFYRLIPKVQSLQGYISTAFAQLEWLKSWERRKEDLGHYVAPSSGESSSQIPHAPSRGIEISVKNLVWSLTPAGSNAGLDFNLNPGEFVCITGKTGIGKTTLIDTMLGLNEYQSGVLTIDGQPVTSLSDESHLKRVSVVTQDVPLFSSSILSNIITSKALDREWLEEVLALTDLTDFVENSIQGLDTIISSRGLSVSGGERQRIGMARAIYAKPGLLVLDEATNGLDEETEKQVLLSIRGLSWKPSILAISHKSSLFRLADRTLRLDSGNLSNIDLSNTGNEID